MRRNVVILILIVCFGAFVRLVQLGSNPPSLTWDEAAWGYNAYSLGFDLKDEFGMFLPSTYLESFGDFKPPVYAYLDIIPVKILGLTEFAVRFPSAFFGILTILLSYYLIKELFGKEKEGYALLTALFLAISPWHIMLSRAAFEANVATFFLLLGLSLFLAGIRKYAYLLPVSAISFVAAMYTFNSPRIVIPILVVILSLVFAKRLLVLKKMTAVAILIGLILYIPLLLFLRFEEVNIFTDIGVIQRTNLQISNDNNGQLSKIIHNRRFAYGVEYLRHFFDNVTPSFLFVKGDGNPKFSTQDLGSLYLWQYPFIIIGVILLFRRREHKWWLVPVLLIASIVPAAFARETPHALRVESGILAFQALTAIGVVWVYGMLKRLKLVFLFGFSAALVFGFAYFFHSYTAHYPREFSGEWQYGYKEAVTYVNSVKNQYSTVYFTESLGRPYIYYLFYSRISPQEFRKNSQVFRESLGFVHVERFDGIHFEKEITKLSRKGALYIATPTEVGEGAKVLREFKLLNGMTSLVAYTL